MGQQLSRGCKSRNCHREARQQQQRQLRQPLTCGDVTETRRATGSGGVTHLGASFMKTRASGCATSAQAMRLGGGGTTPRASSSSKELARLAFHVAHSIILMAVVGFDMMC